MTLKVPPIVWAVTASILAGLISLFSKDLLNSGLGPMEVCLCRQGITAIGFGLFLLIFDRSAFKVRLRDLWIFALFASFNVICNVCLFSAQQLVPLEVAAVLEFTSPYFVLVFAYFLFGDRITRSKVLATVIAFIGCIFIIGLVDGEGDIHLLGVIFGLLSGISLAAFSLGGKYTDQRGFSENTSMFYFFLFSALLIAPLADFGLIVNAATSDWTVLACILMLGVLCTLIPNYLVIYTVRRMDPSTMMIIITSSLIVSTLCGILVFGEEFSITDVIGIVLVMSAIVLLSPPKSLLRRLGKDDGQVRRPITPWRISSHAPQGPRAPPWTSREGAPDRSGTSWRCYGS